MSDGWISDDESLTQYTPIYSQTSGHGGSRRGRGTGRGYGNWRDGGRSDYKTNNQFSTRENGQGFGGGSFDRNKGRNGGSGNFQQNSSGGCNDVVGSCNENKLMVKSNDIGKIIGKGGCKIRELEEESGARIQIGGKCDEDFGQTTSVILLGSDEAVSRAKQLIEDFLNGFVLKSSGNPGNPSSSRITGTAVPEPELQKPDTINWAELNRQYEEAQKVRWSKLPKLLKDFYEEDPDVSNMLPEEVQRFRNLPQTRKEIYKYEEIKRFCIHQNRTGYQLTMPKT